MKENFKTIIYQIMIIIGLLAICIPSIANTTSNFFQNEISNNTIIISEETNTTSEKSLEFNNEIKKINNTNLNIVENQIEDVNEQDSNFTAENLTNEEKHAETNSNVSIENIDVEKNLLETGIYIDIEIKNNFLNVLNYNSIYTYSLNDNNILICDYVKKENDYIDTNNETEVDIILKNILQNINEKIYFIMDTENTITDRKSVV